MATTDEFKIKVTADVAEGINGMKQFDKTLGQLEADLKRLNTDLRTASPAAFRTLQKEIDNTKKQISALTNSGKKDFTNLGRVIQDLPFGMQGIQNNLTQLIPAVGGLGLAFSAVVAAVTFAQIGFSNWTRGLTNSKKATEENSLALILLARDIDAAKESADAFKETLDILNKIGKLRLDIDFGKGLQTDLLNLQGISVGNRELQVKLQETEAIIRDRVGKIREAFLSELDSKQIGAFDAGVLDVESLTEKQRKAFDKLQDAEKEMVQAGKDITKARFDQTIIEAQIEQQRVDIIEDGAKKSKEAREKARRELEKQLRAEAEALEKHLARMSEIKAGFFSVDDPVLIDLQLRVDAKKGRPDTLKEKLTKELIPKEIPLRINVVPEPTIEEKQLEALRQHLSESITETMRAIGTEAFAAIGEGIGAAITGGDMGAVFDDLFQFIGSAIEDLGKQMIKLSPVIQALQFAIKSLNPALMLPAGVALVAIGATLKNIKPKGFQQGGVIPPGFPNDTYYARLTSGERVLTPSQNKEWERGAFGRADMSFPDYLPMHRFDGPDLLMWYARANKQGGRRS